MKLQKNGRSLTVLLLLLGLLCGLLAACGNGNETTQGATTGGETDELPAVESILVTTPIRMEGNSDYTRMKDALGELLRGVGYEVSFGTDLLRDGQIADPGVWEIYLGPVDRAESDALAESIGICGWGIRVDGRKLCVWGSSTEMVGAACEYLSADWFSDHTSPFANVTALEKQYTTLYYLIENGRSNLRLRAADPSDEELTRTVELLRAGLADLAGLSGLPDAEGGVEVIVTKQNASYNLYSSYTSGGAVYIAAADETGLTAAANAFCNLVYRLSGYQSGGSVFYPQGFTYERAVNDALPALPHLEGATLYDANLNETYTVALNGSDLDTFDHYTALLADRGFTLAEEYTVPYTVSGVSYVNTHRVYIDERYTVRCYHIGGNGNIRVIASGVEQHRLAGALEPTEGDVQSSFTMLNIGHYNEENQQGLCLAFQLSDGRFIIVDGGIVMLSDSEAAEVHRLYRWLKERAPDGNIVIAAWLFTHAHVDHVNVASVFEELYGSAKDVTIERYIYNFPSYSYALSAEGTDLNRSIYDIIYPRMQRMLARYECIIAHTGMRLEIGNALIEVLFTHEDFYPQPLRYFNNSSVVYKITIEGQSFLISGDLQEDGQRAAVQQCGSLLESDFLQAVHHGWNATAEYYRCVVGSSATVVVVPVNSGMFLPNNLGNAYLQANLGGNVTEIIYAYDSNKTFMLPYSTAS